MKGDRAAEDELNPSRSADLCWSGRRGRGRAGGGEAGEAGAGRGGQGHCACRRGAVDTPGLPWGPALKPGDSRIRPTPLGPPCLPQGWSNASPLAWTKSRAACLEAGLGLGHTV